MNREFMIHLFDKYSNKLAYLELITVLVYEMVLPVKVIETFSKILEKNVSMDSFPEPATLIKSELYLRYFSRILLNVLKYFFHRTPPSIFGAIVNRL